MNWLERKRDDLYRFDLGALNLLGWLVFLSAFGVIFAGIFVVVDAGGRDGVDGWKKPFAFAIILLGVAWFQVGKFLFGLVGLSVYRASRRDA